MLDGFNPNRYAVINEKNKREIVMLLGTGCKWRKCSFCDYHLDFDTSDEICYSLNRDVLSNVTGVHKKLEVINSGSFTELDTNTMNLIEQVAILNKINEIHFECHYLYRKNIPIIRKRFAKHEIELKLKCGVETFDTDYRERVLNKGMKNASIVELSKYFEEVCLLFGLNGQTVKSMRNDIYIGLENFERICINIMQENACTIKPDYDVIQDFKNEILPDIESDDRIDILMENTAFGVGGVTT